MSEDKNSETIEQLDSVRDWLRYAVSRFSAAGIAFGHGATSALDEAAFVILESLKLPVGDINPWLDARLLREERKAIEGLIEARIATRKPAAYLLGRTYIQGIPFRCDERAIVPRSYIGEVLFSDYFSADGGLIDDVTAVSRALDLCTGGGSLAILAARVFPNALIDAVDLSPDPLALARLNVEDHHLGERVQLLEGDLFAPVGNARYDLIISNPPYVDTEAMRALPPEYRHEPALALDGGEDGLTVVRRIVDGAAAHLVPGGGLICEIGHGRAALETAYPELDFLWLETEESMGEVFWITREQL